MGEASIELNAAMKASASVRNYLSGQHLWMARHSAQRCAMLEHELEGRGFSTHPELRGYAAAAITMSVAFLEACINETFEDAEAFRRRVQTLSGGNYAPHGRVLE